MPEGLKVCINYEFHLLNHVGAVAKAGGVYRPTTDENENDRHQCLVEIIALLLHYNYKQYL